MTMKKNISELILLLVDKGIRIQKNKGSFATGANDWVKKYSEPDTVWYDVHGFYKSGCIHIAQFGNDIIGVDRYGAERTLSQMGAIEPAKTALDQLAQWNIDWHDAREGYEWDFEWLPVLLELGFLKRHETVVVSYSVG